MNTDTRLADFERNEGDTIVYKEWDNEAQKLTGCEVERKIVSVTKNARPRPWTE